MQTERSLMSLDILEMSPKIVNLLMDSAVQCSLHCV